MRAAGAVAAGGLGLVLLAAGAAGVAIAVRGLERAHDRELRRRA